MTTMAEETRVKKAFHEPEIETETIQGEGAGKETTGGGERVPCFRNEDKEAEDSS